VSNAPLDTPLSEFRDLALRRWTVEQCFEECKDELGLDHFEGRSYKRWYRHTLLVMLAQQFLLEIRRSSSYRFRKKVATAMPNRNENIHLVLTLPNARKLVEASIIEGVSDQPYHRESLLLPSNLYQVFQIVLPEENCLLEFHYIEPDALRRVQPVELFFVVPKSSL
jgi:hypothetical protein